mgnify:CR=1 FL=1
MCNVSLIRQVDPKGKLRKNKQQTIIKAWYGMQEGNHSSLAFAHVK